MSVIAIVVIAVGGLLLIMLMGGYVVARRRREHHAIDRNIELADRGLEQARAADRGWDRALLVQAARDALRSQAPGFDYDSIDLVLVDDRPGVVDDRAHMLARHGDEEMRVILGRREGGEWIAEEVEQIE